MKLCVVIREASSEAYEKEMDKHLGAYEVGNCGRIPPSDKEAGEWWAILVRTG